MLDANGLRCERGTRCLFDGLDLALRPGGLLHVEGANGAGKTSLLRLLAGLALPVAGDVNWHGRPIARQRETYARAMLYLGHLPALKDELSAHENLLAHARMRGLAADARMVADALGRCGLGAATQRLAARVLSAGQRRRAALARLLLSAAVPLWILDEPFAALDAAASERLGRTLHDHVSAGGMVVITSHQPLPLQGRAFERLRLAA